MSPLDSFESSSECWPFFLKCIFWDLLKDVDNFLQMLLMTPLMRVDIFFANACFDWVVISGEDGSPLAVGGFHQTLGRQVVFSLSHFFANPVSLMQEVFLCLLDILYFFPGREQSSWLLCLTVKRRTSIRWGEIVPFLILSIILQFRQTFSLFLLGTSQHPDWRIFVNFSISIEEKFGNILYIWKSFKDFCAFLRSRALKSPVDLNSP